MMLYLPVCGPHCEQKLGSWWTMCLYLLRACLQKPNTSSPFSNSVKLSKLLSIVISTWFTAAGFLHLVSRSWQSPVAFTSVSILAVPNGILWASFLWNWRGTRPEVYFFTFTFSVLLSFPTIIFIIIFASPTIKIALFHLSILQNLALVKNFIRSKVLTHR